MIGKLTGIVEPHGLGEVVVDVEGVGYLVRVPLGTLETASAGATTLHVHTVVREDAIDLYGFRSQEELKFFKQLLDVSGVGPKTALGVLNVADVPTLKRTIARGDATALTKVFGIGKKSAERIVVELRDKFSKESTENPTALHGGIGDGEVIEALMALGYSAPESREALKSVSPEHESVRDRLSAALRMLGRSNTK